jgi:hypothetical protein
MKCKSTLLVLVLIAIAFYTTAQSKTSKDKKKPDKEASADSAKAKTPTVEEKTKGNLKHVGLFTMYQDTASGSLQFYIRKDQLTKEFIYQSFSMGGPPELFLNQNMIRETWIFAIRKSFDKIEFVKGNANFYYDPTNAISKAANVDVSESIFNSEKIVAADKDGYLIAADGLFFSEKLDPIKPFLPPTLPPGAVFNLGSLNAGKSSYLKVRSFPANTDVVVSLAYENPAPIKFGGKDITDARYVQVKMQHTFLEVPKNTFKPRYDDPRIGYFTQEMNDMTSTRVPNYKDVITRWHLVKKDPAAEVSEPVEPIVWWVENTTPVEIRQTIIEAGMKWNEAFEKAGFKNAVIMKQMPDNADWDPADVRYNVIRWVSSDLGYAIGPSFINPRTGQILGGDITVDFGLFSGSVFDDETYQSFNAPKLQYGSRHINCNIGSMLRAFHHSATTIVEAFEPDAEELSNLKNQFLTFLILHEMGHTMGLNHNMKSSHMLSPAQLNNKDITRKLGVTGSCMDYPIANMTSDRTQQGDYYTTKTGPYDWWAIEYGYREFTADREADGLNTILGRSNDPQLIFGNDADIVYPGMGIDPRVMVWDMSSDLMSYAEDRFKLVNKTLGVMKGRFVKDGRSYEDLYQRYYSVLGQRYSMAAGVSHYIGGIYIDRSFPEQKSFSKPMLPVAGTEQRRAMALLSTYIFSPNAFEADAALLPYLQRQRRGFNFFGRTEDPKPEQTALQIQSITLNFLLHPTTLTRVTNTTMYGSTYPVADVLTDLVKGCFDDDMGLPVNVYRQNLQAEVVQRLIGIVSDPAKQYDHASVAAAHYQLTSLRTSLAKAAKSGDNSTKAHRSNLVFMIDKAVAIR